MSTLAFGGAGLLRFTPLSAALGDVSNGAGTMAMLLRIGGNPAAGMDMGGLMNSAASSWYHAWYFDNHGWWFEDDAGRASPAPRWETARSADSSGADNFRILCMDWSATAQVNRWHYSGLIGSAESWSHSDGTNVGAGTFAGPGTTGILRIGDIDDYAQFSGEVALVAFWAGVRLGDSGAEELWTNKKTSDWYVHSMGTPITLIETTSITPTDVGSAPSTFGSIVGTATATGADPTGWTFDGQGAAPDWPPAGSENSTAKLWTPTAAKLR